MSQCQRCGGTLHEVTCQDTFKVGLYAFDYEQTFSRCSGCQDMRPLNFPTESVLAAHDAIMERQGYVWASDPDAVDELNQLHRDNVERKPILRVTLKPQMTVDQLLDELDRARAAMLAG